MLNFLLILIIIASILLIIIILAQNPKSGGGGLTSIGSGASQFLGARQTADFLEKSTWYLGIGILVIVIFSYFMVSPSSGGTKSRVESSDFTPTMTQQAPGAPAVNPLQQLPPKTSQKPANGGQTK
jgi:preprotein translocase subunit SecG